VHESQAFPNIPVRRIERGRQHDVLEGLRVVGGSRLADCFASQLIFHVATIVQSVCILRKLEENAVEVFQRLLIQFRLGIVRSALVTELPEVPKL